MVKHRHAIDGFLLKQFYDNLRELEYLVKDFGTRSDYDDLYDLQDVYHKFNIWVDEVDENTRIFMEDYIHIKFTDSKQREDALNQLNLFLPGFIKSYFRNPHHAKYM